MKFLTIKHICVFANGHSTEMMKENASEIALNMNSSIMKPINVNANLHLKEMLMENVS